MARGRIITNEITRDKKINDLSDDTSRLAFTWLITFADVEGRTYGDPAIVRSMLFPRRTDVTIEQMTVYIHEWAEAGLVEWYEADGDLFIHFPKFTKHQHLQKDRESPSKIPPPSGVTLIYDNGKLQSYSGITPDQITLKLIKVNLREEEGEVKPPPPAATEYPAPICLDKTQALRIYAAVTGQVSFLSGSYDLDIERICNLYDVHHEGLVDYLKPFFDEWVSRGYRKSNTAWLDWAVAGEISMTKEQREEAKWSAINKEFENANNT